MFPQNQKCAVAVLSKKNYLLLKTFKTILRHSLKVYLIE